MIMATRQLKLDFAAVEKGNKTQGSTQSKFLFTACLFPVCAQVSHFRFNKELKELDVEVGHHSRD